MEENQTESPSQSPNSLNPILFSGIILVVAVVVGLLFLTQKDNRGEIASTSVQSAEITVAVPTSSVIPTQTALEEAEDTVEIVNVEAGSFYYKPNEIRVKKGQKVKIVLKAVDMMHDFNIEELDVSLPITKSGETSSVEFVANTSGTFEYYCSVGQHRKMGQVGKLIVE